MKFIRITRDVWVNLEKVDSIVELADGTALVQMGVNSWTSEIPFGAIISRTIEEPPVPVAPPAQVSSPLISTTEPAW